MAAASTLKGRLPDEQRVTAIAPTSFSEVGTDGGSDLYRNVPSTEMVKSKRPLLSGHRHGQLKSLKFSWPIFGYIVGLLLVVSLCFELRRKRLSGGLEQRRLAGDGEPDDDAGNVEGACRNILSGASDDPPSDSPSADAEAAGTPVGSQQDSETSGAPESPEIGGTSSEASARRGEVSAPGVSGDSSQSKSGLKRRATAEESGESAGSKVARVSVETTEATGPAASRSEEGDREEQRGSRPLPVLQEGVTASIDITVMDLRCPFHEFPVLDLSVVMLLLQRQELDQDSAEQLSNHAQHLLWYASTNFASPVHAYSHTRVAELGCRYLLLHALYWASQVVRPSSDVWAVLTQRISGGFEPVSAEDMSYQTRELTRRLQQAIQHYASGQPVDEGEHMYLMDELFNRTSYRASFKRIMEYLRRFFF